MAQPAPEFRDEPALRVSRRTYTGDSEPLVEVLMMLYDWSIERELRVQARVPMPPEDDEARG